ncbi:MAG: hypothetical protein ACJ8AK_04460 [Gemmatimonadaceae bacterium]
MPGRRNIAQPRPLTWNARNNDALDRRGEHFRRPGTSPTDRAEI